MADFGRSAMPNRHNSPLDGIIINDKRAKKYLF